jgi:HPt (histidine-containing phosphotransfer) domain-containing protein
MDSRTQETIAPETIRIDMPPGLENIMPAYLAWRREEVPELIALLAASDFERLAHLSHNIKGTGTSYGLPDLSRIGADLELASKLRDTSAAGAQLTQLNYYLEHVQVVAREHTPEVSD